MAAKDNQPVLHSEVKETFAVFDAAPKRSVDDSRPVAATHETVGEALSCMETRRA